MITANAAIDYGLFPDESIALLRERRVATVRGNHRHARLCAGK